MNAFTGKDAFGLYLSSPLGAAAGGTLGGCLGGARMPMPVRAMDALVADAFPSLIIEHLGGTMAEGTGYILGTGSDLRFRAPGEEDYGPTVTVANGAAKVLTSDGGTAWVRVRRDRADGMIGIMSLDVRKVYGAIAGQDVDADSAGNEYLARFITNDSEASATVKVYLKPLGTTRTTTLTQLGGAGGGFINCGGTNLADWPAQGFALIRTSGGTVREWVYYSERTASTLTVPAGGNRGLFGTASSAGANTDTITPLPGMRIALETPDSDGLIQTIADTSTAPTGVTWDYPYTTGTALTATLAPGASVGLWTHKLILADQTATLNQEVAIVIETGGDATTYRGLHRVASSGAAQFEVYHGVDAFPDFSGAADATEASLPFTFALSAPPSGVRDHHITVRETDVYGVTGYNTFPHRFLLNSSGALLGDVSAPYGVALTEIGSGYVRLVARYAYGIDDTPADTWRYYVTTDGTDPDPDPDTDTPVEVDMQIGQGLSEERVLNVILGPYTYATDLRVLVRAYESTGPVESDNTEPETIEIELVNPVTPALGGAAIAAVQNYEPGPGFATVRTNLDSPTNSVYWRTMPGTTELWANGGLVLRAMATGSNQVTLHLPSDWSMAEGSVSGAGSANPIEVASGTQLYICVGGTRRVSINASTKTITADEFDATGSILPEDAPPVGPAVACAGFTCLQVYDQVLGRWRSFIAVDAAGKFSARWIIQRSS